MAKAVKPKKTEIAEPVIINEQIPEVPIPEPLEDIKPSVVEYVEKIKPDIVKQELEERVDDTIESAILNYLDSKDNGEHQLNDFIKSLFPIPKFNEPPIYLTQENSRNIRHVLENMRLEGKIAIVNNLHNRLGEHWYEPETGVAKRHNLSTVKIVAKK